MFTAEQAACSKKWIPAFAGIACPREGVGTVRGRWSYALVVVVKNISTVVCIDVIPICAVYNFLVIRFVSAPRLAFMLS